MSESAVAAELRGIVEPGLAAEEAGAEVRDAALAALTTLLGTMQAQVAALPAQVAAQVAQHLAAQLAAQHAEMLAALAPLVLRQSGL